MKTLTRFVIALVTTAVIPPVFASEPIKLKRVRTQFIAALGAPDATQGTNAHTWGIWVKDPGPRGVWLRNFDKLGAAGGQADANWQFDNNDWWLDENGLLMEKPVFELAAGNYLVTGDREVTTLLTVFPKDKNGEQRWELADGATLHDVTHMPCRTARYTPAEAGADCTPHNADQSKFKVAPGTVMPSVPSCHKQDYAVLFIVAVDADT